MAISAETTAASDYVTLLMNPRLVADHGFRVHGRSTCLAVMDAPPCRSVQLVRRDWPGRFVEISGGLTMVGGRRLSSRGRSRPSGRDGLLDGRVAEVFGEDPSGSSNSEPWAPDLVRDEILTFLFAGHETTALTLCYALDLVANDPEVAERVRQEARTVLGDEKPS